MKVKICHLYPDVLGLYGDRGNIICLSKRLEWRGFECEVTSLCVGEIQSLGEYDIIFVGGGQDFEQGLLLEDLKRGMAAEIRAASEDGKVILGICGGYQLLGNHYKTLKGETYEYTGALNVYTTSSDRRMVGDLMFECAIDGCNDTLTGFENHAGQTFLGDGVTPLGHVLKGFGNNGEDGTEGARARNTFGSYAHGPLLPKNPRFADFLISLALGGIELPPLDDSLEMSAGEYMVSRLAHK